MSNPSLTVITVTLARQGLLERALESVAGQDYGGHIHSLVFVDATASSAPFKVPPSRRGYTNEVVVSPIRVEESEPTVARVARMRNLAIAMTRSPFVAFLDDDNEWLPYHLQSLFDVRSAASEPAAHSWRVLVDREGREVVPQTFPWEPDEADARRRFSAALEAGLFERSSSVVRDRAYAYTTLGDIGMIDLGEWLLRRDLLLETPFATEYSETELAHGVGEDDKLLESFKAKGVEIAETRQASLKYSLGGFSNSVSTEGMLNG